MSHQAMSVGGPFLYGGQVTATALVSQLSFVYLFSFFETGSLVGWERPKCASACLRLWCKGCAYTLPHTHAVGAED